MQDYILKNRKLKTYTYSNCSLPSGNVMSEEQGVSELIIFLIPGYEPGFWSKACGGSSCFQKAELTVG